MKYYPGICLELLRKAAEIFSEDTRYTAGVRKSRALPLNHTVVYLSRNTEARSRDYATVDEAVFSPCLAEPSRVTYRVESPRLASPRLLPGNSYKHLDDARVGKGHVTASAVTSRVFPHVRSKVYKSSQ
jgi:hypothetical protein